MFSAILFVLSWACRKSTVKLSTFTKSFKIVICCLHVYGHTPFVIDVWILRILSVYQRSPPLSDAFVYFIYSHIRILLDGIQSCPKHHHHPSNGYWYSQKGFVYAWRFTIKLKIHVLKLAIYILVTNISSITWQQHPLFFWYLNARYKQTLLYPRFPSIIVAPI